MTPESDPVSIIASTAERQAAVAFATAAAIRPEIVGKALRDIAEDGEVLAAMFDVMETQKLTSGHTRLTLMPENSGLLGQLLTADMSKEKGAETSHHAAHAAPLHSSGPGHPHGHGLPPYPHEPAMNFTCPTCQTTFPVDRSARRIVCPTCRHVVALA